MSDQNDLVEASFVHEFDMQVFRDGHWLYTIKGEGGAPIYVGVSQNVLSRIADHSILQRRFSWDEVTGVTIELIGDKVEAHARERDLIDRRRPKYNVIHNPDHAYHKKFKNRKRSLGSGLSAA